MIRKELSCTAWSLVMVREPVTTKKLTSLVHEKILFVVEHFSTVAPVLMVAPATSSVKRSPGIRWYLTNFPNVVDFSIFPPVGSWNGEMAVDRSTVAFDFLVCPPAVRLPRLRMSCAQARDARATRARVINRGGTGCRSKR